MTKTLELNVSFDAQKMFRLDSLIMDEIKSCGFEKGVIRITGPEGIFFTTLEFDKDLVSDFSKAYQFFDKKIRKDLDPYLCSKLPDNVMEIPVNLHRLVIGDWQQIVFYTTRSFKSINIQLDFYTSNNILGLESINTTSELQTFDVTDIIERTLMNSNADSVTMIVPSSSVILYTLKPEYYEKMIDMLFTIAPRGKRYKHIHGDDRNRVGYTPLRSAFISQVVTVDTHKGSLDLQGERLYLTEMDIQTRRRDIYFELWNKGDKS